MRIFFSLWSILVLVLATGAYSCKDDEADTYLKLETGNGNPVTDPVQIGLEGATEPFTVRSNGAWAVTVSGEESWLKVDPASGTNDGTFNLTVDPNDTFDERSAELAFFVDGKQRAEMSVVQACIDVRFAVTPDQPGTIPYTGREIEFGIETNAPAWEYAVEGGEWLTERSKIADALVLEAPRNTGTADRSVTLRFTVPGYDDFSKEVPLVQRGDNAPKADLLDVVFEADGTARDVSAAARPVATLDGSTLTTVYSNTYRRYVGRFGHTPGASGMTSGFYKADYSADAGFMEAIRDGHSLEAVFRLDLETIPNAEIKVLSSHEGGGTGLMLGNASRGNSIIFLPHVGASGYVWTNSGITPARGEFYHVVGVWNKEENKSCIYVNGELKASVETNGDFNFPAQSCRWFGVGADPSSENSAATGWTGDIALARVYDNPLSPEEVEKLWNQAKDYRPAPDEIELKGLLIPSKPVLLANEYTLKGEGFAPGDRIRMEPLSGTGKEHTCEGIVSGNTLTLQIPADFSTGRYRFHLLRGARTLDLGFAVLTVVDELPDTPEVIAHRGYHAAGAPQNSVAALVAAQEVGVYGSEFDVWITPDGVVVLNHDADIDGYIIENTPYETELKQVRLGNGEPLPTLEDYLEQGRKDPTTKLILEIKTHSGSTGGVSNNDRAAEAVVKQVAASGLRAQVEYIAFSLDVCKKLVALFGEYPQAAAPVAYLSGNLTPQALQDLGIPGIDYNISVLRANPQWITEAQALGMTVNVWTVSDAAGIQEMIDAGVDYITTDAPVLAKSLTGK